MDEKSYDDLLFEISIMAGLEKDVNSLFQKCLDLTGKRLNVSRTYIFHRNYSKGTINNTFEWTNERITPQKEDLQDISEEDISWWTNILKKQNIINYENINDINDHVVREILQAQDIRSILIAPLFVEDKYFGFIGFDQCKYSRQWTSNDIKILLSLAMVIAQASLRSQIEKTLEKERTQLLSILDNMEELCYIADMESYELLFANKNLRLHNQYIHKGEKCFKVLQGKDKPCDFCTNDRIKKKEICKWEYHNPILNKDFYLMDRTIKWTDGKNVRLEVAMDITERKKVEKIIFEEKERLKVTLLSIGDGVITTDNMGNVVMLNKVAETMTGWKSEEAAGQPLKNIFNIIHKETRIPCQNPVKKVLETKDVIGLENHTVLIAKDLTERDIADSAAPIKDNKDTIIGVVLVFRDVTKEEKRKEKIRYLSYYDSLTGLFNRAFFEQKIKMMNKKENFPISLIMGDVNGLKMTNDVFGHHQGDHLLKVIASVLKESCREDDIVARWGGDEFVILMSKTSNKKAQFIVDRIKENCMRRESEAIHLSISLGCATKVNEKDNILGVLKKAEDFMYKSKLLESKSLRNAIIVSMQKTLFEKSNETEEHATRLGEHCSIIGKKMNLSSNELNELQLLSVLHDIGKIAINDTILGKVGRLTDEEWIEMRRHPEIGCRITQSIPELAQVSEYILCHHERWDGKGYPQGLRGEEIPLQARIIAVADAFDAMTFDRTYRKALPFEQAIQELRENAGTQFDQEVVHLFIDYLKDTLGRM